MVQFWLIPLAKFSSVPHGYKHCSDGLTIQNFYFINFLLGLKSGDCLGQTRRSWDTLAACLGSLSWWNIYLLCRFSFLASEIKFSSNMSHFSPPFMFHSMSCHAPVPLAEIQPHIMMPPPSYIAPFLESYVQPLLMNFC